MSNHSTARPTSTTVPDPVAQTPKDDYMDNARLIVVEGAMESIAEDAVVQAAFEGLKEWYGRPGHGLDPAVKLLNAISLAYYTASSDDMTLPAVIFSLDKGTHDYLGVGCSPDLISYAAPIEQLRDVVRNSTTQGQEPRDWSTFLSAGEAGFRGLRKGEFHANIDWWTNIINMCRPDLPVVHAFHFADGPLRLSSFDASGVSHSDDIPLRTLDAWIVHVALIYDALDKRDYRFTYLGPGADTARWAFETGAADGTKICVEPFWASSSAGRRTVAAFSTCCHGGEPDPVHYSEAEGFLKISWQTRNPSKPSEGALLDRAHRKSWLPGLVRHWGYWEGGPEGTTIDDDGRDRIKEILHLGSIGQPLSRCRSAGHVLRVFFDIFKVHRALDDRGVLHRDLSPGNVLCEPRHDPILLKAYAGKPVGTVKEVPCIGYVLTGDESQEPCALITDLDMGFISKTEAGVPIQAPLTRIGTPGFVAIEQCNDEPEELMLLDRSVLNDLLKKLSVIDDYPTERDRMFPDGKSGDFIDFVTHVFEVEAARTVPATTSRSAHLPRHDVECLFWDLFYTLARACPLGFDPLDDLNGAYTLFIEAIFKHDFYKETRRPYFTQARFEEILHPALRRFAPLLTSMLQYLSIPWHLHNVYEDDFIGRYHAHIAMECLLFAEVIAMARDASLDVRLNIEQPRIQNLKTRKQLLEEQQRLAAASTPGTSVATATATATASSTTAASTSTDTTLAGDVDESQGPAKRKRLGETDDDATARSKRQKGDAPSDAPQESFVPSYDIRDLSEMFWRYRKAWFGRGWVPSGPKQPAMEAREEWLFPFKQVQRQPKQK